MTERALPSRTSSESPWTERSWRRWERADGAAVLWDDRSPFPNPENPRALMWTAWAPGADNHAYLARRNHRYTWPRRWKTAHAAMREVDRLYPFEKSADVADGG